LAAAYRAYLLAKLGRTGEARDVLAQLTARAADEYVPPYAVAVIHAGLNDVEAAFDWLDRALDARDAGLLDLGRDRRLDALRSDLRFESLMRRCGCADASADAT
jgi:hypothetical protein